MRSSLPLLAATILVLVILGVSGLVAAWSFGAPANSARTARLSLSAAGTAPHPFAVPVGTPALAVHNSHWWAGAAYAGANLTPNQARFTLTVPDAQPSSAEFYYVLMSVWDNAASYDQVGISNDNGVWGWTYSWTSYCAGSYNYNPAQTTLTRGLTYSFFMNISAGKVVFSVVHNGSTVARLTAATGGTHFVMKQLYSCSSSTYYDFTDYEEAYTTVQTNPSFSFLFVSNLENNVSIGHWALMGSPPGGGKILYGIGVVTVANQKFSVAFGATSPDALTLAAGTTSFSSSIVVHKLLYIKTAKLAVSGLPTGFSVTFTPASGHPPFSAVLGFTIAKSASSGTYDLTVTATDAAGNFSYVTLEVVLL